MKKHRYQIAALMMSVIIATGSLSGSVFAAETSGDTTESSVVEEIAETDACRIEHIISPETFRGIKKFIKEHKDEP